MSTVTPAKPATGGLPIPQFFVDVKKGEVNELRVLLRAVSLDKDPVKKRDIIKKVIAYMTLGIDVSRLYPEMVKASRTDDIVMKKMIYLYLTNYAEQNQELAILAINTFLMDLKGTNGKIRGLALRSLCSLKFDGVFEYMQ
jgi:AP-4 complex subunit beta-1